MLTLNDKERILREQLKKDADIPFVVHERVNRAYRMIDHHQVKQKAPVKNPTHWMKTAYRIAGSLAAVFVLAFVLCIANPVMAKNLPLVGGLFEQLQNHVSFFGNFADKATPLTEPDAPAAENADAANDAEASDTAASSSDPSDATAADGVYTKTSDGLTITFSEVYANDQAIYLTMTAKSEEPFPPTMMSQTEIGEEQPLFNMTFVDSYSFLPADSSYSGVGSTNPEGIFIDENTYSCILRLDLAEVKQDTSEFTAQYDAMVQEVLDEMGITSDDMNDETEEGYALLTEFNDRVSARGGALRSYIKEIDLPDTFDLHLNITQFVGYKADPEYWDSGYSEEELTSMSDEEWREVMSQMPKEYNMFPNEHENYWYDGPWTFDIPITVDTSQTVTLELNDTNDAGIGLKSVIKTPYELTVNELYEEGSDSDTFMVALDANGNKLPYNDSNSSCNNFAIQDRDISTVDIYILDYTQYMDELKGPDYYNNNENKPEEEKWSTLLDANAMYHKTINFQ